MANIPIRDIPGPVVVSPSPSNLIPMDNGSIMQKTTIANAVNTALPLASQATAEAGVNNSDRMSSLRTKQAIDAQVPTIVGAAITALNLGTMSQETASDYTKTSGLAAVALSNDYNDLDSLPTLGTAAATDAIDYATAAQGSLADTAIQPGDAALVPSGGTIGQVLVKNSGTNYDTGWVSSAAATAVSYAPQTLTDAQAGQARANIGATLLGDFRNLLVNPLGLINQRGYTSGAATSVANRYTLDRWRVVTSGQNLSWTESAGVRTMTAPAGGVEQMVEGGAIISGDHVLNWEGTATATVDGTPMAKGAVFTLTGGTNATIRFSGGTFSKPQLERGKSPTEFAHRHPQQELALCQRYFRPTPELDVILYGVTGGTFGGSVYFPITISPMRTTPTVVDPSWTSTTGTSNRGLVAMSPSELRFFAIASATGMFRATSGTPGSLDAEL